MTDHLTDEADVICPHCGAPVTMTLDPGGGPEQEYVEDCEVCCRPWLVHLRWDLDGDPDIELEPA